MLRLNKLKKIVWIVCMAVLSLTLYTIVISRNESYREDVILGGVDGVYVGQSNASTINPDSYNVVADDGLDWPDIDITLTQFTLVNSDNLLSSASEPDLAKKDDGETNQPIYGTRWQYFSASAKPYIDQMLEDMYELGFTPYIASSYRTYSYQAQLYNTKTTAIFMEMGYAADDWNKEGCEEAYAQAAEEAAVYTAKPGSSEHQLGLAVDIWDKERTRVSDYYDMDEEFRTWLEQNACEYGFIQRYPTNKCLRTGYDEPWHWRYVGKDVAVFMKENNLCYEEFYAHYSSYGSDS